jgi:hypothetical protein
MTPLFRCFFLVTAMALLPWTGAKAQTTNYVSDLTGNDSWDGLTWGTAKKTIQGGIAAAASGDTVLVTNGIYYLASQINLWKALTIQSVGGPTETIIDGSNTCRCINISNAGAVIDGFSIRNGFSDQGGVGVYGQPGGVLRNCYVYGNVSSNANSAAGNTGGGIYFEGGAVEQCEIYSNSTTSGNGGGGVYLNQSGTVTRCNIYGNYCYGDGSGARCNQGGVVEDCSIHDNPGKTGARISGGAGTFLRCKIYNNVGGAKFAGGIVQNCLIYNNSGSEFGGGVKLYALESTTLENCTITGNRVTDSGGGVFVYEGGNGTGIGSNIIRNVILYGNFAQSNGMEYACASGVVFAADFSCVDPIPALGVGNIIAPPLFMDATNANFRLQSGSLCIDSGTNLDWMGTAIDIEGHRRIFNGRVDMGASEKAILHVATNSLVDGPGTEWSNAFHTIQGAVAVSLDFDTVLVSNGTYVLTSPILITNGITLRSTSGTNFTTVDGNYTTRCFSVSHPLAVVEGFTITRGSNTLDWVGGGAYMSAGTIQDCTIISNSAVYRGGGIYLDGGGTVLRCTVQNNQVTPYTYGGGGAGICFEAGGIVRDSMIISNVTIGTADGKSGLGAGVCFFDAGFMENCTVLGNKASTGGSSALRFNYGGVATNCTITQNISTDGSGVIRFSSGGSLYDCTISSNSSPGTTVFNNYGTGSTVEKCRIIGNVGGNGPGGCPFMKDCMIAQNQATNGGGGGLTLQSGWLAVGCTIVSNSASQSGGGVDSQGGTLIACTINSNMAGQVGGGANCNGGALSNCVITGNTVRNWGGGLNCSGGTLLEDCLISNNVAQGGGGVNCYQSGTLRRCSIVNNVATNWDSGGVHLEQGGLLDNCTISGNSAPNVGGVMCNGGILQDCIISGNSASNWAGGVGLNPQSLIQRCTISNNTAQGAGAANMNSGSVMRVCRIVGNTATQWGSGGVHCELGGELINCLIANNTASNSGGGGVNCNKGGSLLNCVITNNVGLWGGGVDCYQGGSVIGCLITGNNGGGSGGGVKLYDGGIVQNCTISSNIASQGGGAQLDLAGTVRNCILYGNSSGNGGNYYSDGSIVFSYTCTTPDPSGISNTVSNPLFVDPAGGDFRLATNSPCIDQGVYADWMTNSTDLEGKPRIIHGAVDMGAFEAILPSWDTDIDTIPDLWTWEHFGHLTGLADDLSRATDSADGTGRNNLYKYAADLDPTNPLSFFQIAAVSNMPPSRFVRFLSSSNRVYGLKWSTNLVSGSWMDVSDQTNVWGTGTLMSLGDTNPATLRFYKVDVKAP